MKLFLISQGQNDGYETYDAAVVAAPDDETAKYMDPGTGKPVVWEKHYLPWCDSPEHVTVRYLGEAAEGVEQGVVCAVVKHDIRRTGITR